MLLFKEVRDEKGNVTHIETSLKGHQLLNAAKLNKCNAFSNEERKIFGLTGKLPYEVETLEQQAARIYKQNHEMSNNLQKNIHLTSLRDMNETLYFKVVGDNIKEMLPIIYTPTVGEAVEHFSLEMRKPRGLYLSFPEIDRVDEILDNRLNQFVKLIVATDGEGVLGIGDQGVGGMNISIAKLNVYTLCGGIHPHHVLPMQLDVGTNNEKLLNDPMYLGWRHERIEGDKYYDFIDKFVTAVHKKFPHIYLHWEDFGRENARTILNKYRDKICTFNDDIQGTGAVTLATVLAGIKANDEEITDQRVVILGGGTAGCGVADQIKAAMMKHGLSEKDAAARFWIVDRQGLLMSDMNNLTFFQEPYARSRDDISNWKLTDANNIQLVDVVKNAKPTILIGCSTVTGAFTEEIIKFMDSYTPNHPIILPLSNPTSKAEQTPTNILKWTNGKALIGTGSPFAPVDFNGREYVIAQTNNALVYPGIGLGITTSLAKHVTDELIWTACSTLSDNSPAIKDKSKPLLPDLKDVRKVNREIGIAVAKRARKDGLARIDDSLDIETEIDKNMWEPKYYDYKLVDEVQCK